MPAVPELCSAPSASCWTCCFSNVAAASVWPSACSCNALSQLKCFSRVTAGAKASLPAAAPVSHAWKQEHADRSTVPANNSAVWSAARGKIWHEAASYGVTLMPCQQNTAARAYRGPSIEFLQQSRWESHLSTAMPTAPCSIQLLHVADSWSCVLGQVGGQAADRASACSSAPNAVEQMWCKPARASGARICTREDAALRTTDCISASSCWAGDRAF